jgi:hypothetical protein
VKMPMNIEIASAADGCLSVFSDGVYSAFNPWTKPARLLIREVEKSWNKN